MTRLQSLGAGCASPTRSSPTARLRSGRHSGPAAKPDQSGPTCGEGTGRVTGTVREALGPNRSACQYHEPAVPDDRPIFEDLYRDYLGRIYAYVRAQVPTAA